MLKNTAGQKVAILAYDIANNAPKTGDANNITAYISKDGAAAVQSNDVNPAELSAANMPGVYVFDLTGAETNCETFFLYAKSATPDVQINPVKIETDPALDVNIYYVAKTGNDANGGHSMADAKLTIAAAISAAAAGDVIIVCQGTYTEQFSIGKALTLKAKELGGVIITNSAGGSVISVQAALVNLENLIVINTHITNGTGISAQNNDLSIRNCFIQGTIDGLIFNNYPTRISVEDSTIIGTYDSLALGSAKNVIIRGCKIYNDGSYDVTVLPTRAITTSPASSGYNILIKDTIVESTRALNGDSYDVVGMYLGIPAILDNVLIKINHTGTGAHYTRGLYITGSAAQVLCKKVNIKTSGSAGTVRDIDVESGSLKVADCFYDTTKTNGTITDVSKAIQTQTDKIVAGGATAAAVAAHDARLDGVIEKTSRIDAMIEDSEGDRFTAKALETSPTAEMSEDELHAALDSYVANGGDIKSIKELADWLKNVAEGDAYIDKTTTPWQLVVHKKGDANTEYIRKDLKDVNGANITSETVAIGQHKEPA